MDVAMLKKVVQLVGALFCVGFFIGCGGGEQSEEAKTLNESLKSGELIDILLVNKGTSVRSKNVETAVPLGNQVDLACEHGTNYDIFLRLDRFPQARDDDSEIRSETSKRFFKAPADPGHYVSVDTDTKTMISTEAVLLPPSVLAGFENVRKLESLQCQNFAIDSDSDPMYKIVLYPKNDLSNRVTTSINLTPRKRVAEVLATDVEFQLAGFNISNARIGASLAELAYFNATFVKTTLENAGFDYVSPLYGQADSTEFYFAIRNNVFFIAARGTQEPEDMVRDASSVFNPQEPEETLTAFAASASFQNYKALDGYYFAKGFHDFGYQIFTLLKESYFVERTGRNLATMPIFLAGHSLGGAAVNVAAAYIVGVYAIESAGQNYIPLKDVLLYSVGSPRAMGESLAKTFSDFSDSDRFGRQQVFLLKHPNDPVPSVPSFGLNFPPRDLDGDYDFFHNQQLFALNPELGLAGAVKEQDNVATTLADVIDISFFDHSSAYYSNSLEAVEVMMNE